MTVLRGQKQGTTVPAHKAGDGSSTIKSYLTAGQGELGAHHHGL